MSIILFRSSWILFRKPPIFSMYVDDLFAPQNDQIYHFIQILFSLILNFEWRTPADLLPGLPPGPQQPLGGLTKIKLAGTVLVCGCAMSWSFAH